MSSLARALRVWSHVHGHIYMSRVGRWLAGSTGRRGSCVWTLIWTRACMQVVRRVFGRGAPVPLSAMLGAMAVQAKHYCTGSCFTYLPEKLQRLL